MICTLNVVDNQCPHLVDKKYCSQNGVSNNCGFRQEEVVEKYVRKERWYEKYYK